MSYHLYRVHWKVYKDGKPIEEKYSFHRDDTVVAEFIRQTVKNNSAEFQYRTEGPGSEHLVDGNLHHEVMQSKELGIWRNANEMVVA